MSDEKDAPTPPPPAPAQPTTPVIADPNPALIQRLTEADRGAPQDDGSEP